MSNGWIEADDTQIKKKQWPRGAKDLYIFFHKKLVINNLDILYILTMS